MNPKNLSPSDSASVWKRKVLLLVLVSGSYLFLFLRLLLRVGDEGLVVYGAQLVSEGRLPYRDFVEVFGPASFYWLATFFSLFGNNVYVARVVLLATSILTVILIYWMTRRLYRGPYEMLPALFYLTTGIPMWPATSHHWDSNLFALLGIGSFFLWLDKQKNKAYLLLTGIVSGITTCFIQQKGGGLLIAFLLLAFVLEDDRTRGRIKRQLANATVLCSGYISVLGSVFLFFSWKGGQEDFLYSTVLWPITWYHGVNTVPYGFGLFSHLLPVWQGALQTFLPGMASKLLGFVFLFPFLILFVLPLLNIALGIMLSFYSGGKNIFFHPSILPYWGVGFALWASEMHRMDYIHTVYGSPILLIVFFYLLGAFPEDKTAVLAKSRSVIAICLLFLGTYNAVAASGANVPIHTRRGVLFGFGKDSALEFLLENTVPGESVFIYPYYPMYYFLADVKNPTRYNNLIYGYHTPAQFQEVINDLERNNVRYILWDTYVEGSNLRYWFPSYQHPPRERLHLEQYLERNYDMIGTENKFRILRRRE